MAQIRLTSSWRNICATAYVRGKRQKRNVNDLRITKKEIQILTTCHFKMKKRIDKTITMMKEKGLTPTIINLTEKDYKEFVKEIDVVTREGEDYADGEIRELQFYRDVMIECMVLDKDEALKIHPMLAESYIASSTKFQGINYLIPRHPLTGYIRKLIPVENGRAFNIKTLQEIL